MPNNYSVTRNERVYIKTETTFGQIATVTGSNCCRFINAGLKQVVSNNPRPDKTGTQSQVIGLLGRKSATWNLSMSLAGNGGLGVVPDCAPVLQCLFGAAPTIVTSTSVTYALADANPIPSFSLWDYRTPTGLEQRVAFGCVVGEATFTLGQNIATWSASGTGVWDLDSVNFSTEDAIQKGGLSSFPAEPVSPVTNGNSAVGFTGVATIAGNVIAEMQTATIRLQTGNAVVNDTFGSYYPVLSEGAMRSAGIAFTIYDNDGSGINAIKAASIAQTPIAISMQIGTIGGNIWTFSLANVQVAPASYDDSRNRYICSWPESLAHATSISVRDELTLAIT